MVELIKLAEMVGVMHEADHAYSIRSTWWLHRLAIDVPVIACVISSPCTFTYYLDLSIFVLESGLSYFKVLTICLLLVYFVSAAGCHRFDFWCGICVVKYCSWEDEFGPPSLAFKVFFYSTESLTRLFLGISKSSSLPIAAWVPNHVIPGNLQK